MNELYITSKNLIFIILNVLLFSVIIYILFNKNKEGFSVNRQIGRKGDSQDVTVDLKNYTENNVNELKSELDQLVEETNKFREQTTQMENQTKEIEKETQEILTEITELEKIFESIKDF